MKCEALKLVPVEAPELLREALTDDLFAKVRLTPVPVQIIAAPDVASSRPFIGVCFERHFAEHGEIGLAAELLMPISDRLKPRQIKDIQSVYLHEVAHRLLPDGYMHNAAFLCLVMVMYLRAGDFIIHRASVYDASDEPEFGASWPWAWELAQQLRHADLSIEQVAAQIVHEYAAWQARDRGDPAEQAALAARQQRIRKARESEIRSYCFAAGLAVAAMAAYII